VKAPSPKQFFDRSKWRHKLLVDSAGSSSPVLSSTTTLCPEVAEAASSRDTIAPSVSNVNAGPLGSFVLNFCASAAVAQGTPTAVVVRAAALALEQSTPNPCKTFVRICEKNGLTGVQVRSGCQKPMQVDGFLASATCFQLHKERKRAG
jgi:hypothetical protein